jgi:predicted phage-related endonuclease
MLDDFTRAQRAQYLGSSDAAAICGKDPWRNAADVFLEKTGQVPGFAGSKVTEIGQYLEGGILAWAEAELQTTFARDQFHVAADNIRCANLDALALALDPVASVEAKCAGLIARPRYFEEFGEPGTDEVPDHITIQVNHQFGVLDDQGDIPHITLALVPVLLVGRGFVLYRVPRSDALVDAIKEREQRFWRDHVAARVMPPDVVPSLDVLRLRTREEKKRVTIPDAVVARWLTAKDQLKQAEESEAATRRALLSQLDDAEMGDCPAGVVTYTATKRKGYVVEETTVRSLRFKAAKAEKAA